MLDIKDSELLTRVASIYSQQKIADTISHPREVVNRWLKESSKGHKDNWLTFEERVSLESLLPSKPDKDEYDFTFIDLFAGIGGIRRGFEKVGGKCVFTSEYDKYAVKTYLANFYCDHDVHGDIREITQPNGLSEKQIPNYINKKVPNHDVLLAGFPCQPFSIAGVSKKNSLGRSHGFEDETQGTLFFDVARIIKVKKPAAILLENVKNLKTHDRGKTFKVITNALHELGYRIVDLEYEGKADPKIINGKHFVPQNRERIVIVAFRKDLKVSTGLTLTEIKKYYPTKAPKVGDILEPKSSIDPKYTLTPKLWEYLQGYAKKHKKAGNGFGFGKVTEKDLSTRTLSARYYKDGSEILVDQGKGKRPRRLTPKECARLMGFDLPGESKFVIPVSDTQAYKQFGNSVVCPVFEAVAKLMKPYIIEAVTNKNYRKELAA
ncbi:DNA cytosine methyltransferase [Kangiella japonica]|uniref:Cytosine-specific methyltransferase n=1 Tax=Kangiella japonica TaxID=647384 RepID=A0ABN0SUF9_9GAMM